MRSKHLVKRSARRAIERMIVAERLYDEANGGIFSLA
jgi:hypothetical protein